jgi:TPP-dependent pyruvate/acetoin dehydrogenase alpha subunit
MNFAGVFKAPTVFFCQNNGWAISVPFSRQTASETIHVKAEAYGFEGVRVDGNDVLATHVVTSQAVRHARSGNGPTLIEAVTYRMGPHSSSDDPKRYRADREVEAWKEKDPIERFRRYLEGRGVWTLGWQEELAKRVDDQISEAVKHAESVSPPPFEDLFTDVYAEMPPHLREQLETFLKSGERRRLGDSDAFPL